MFLYVLIRVIHDSGTVCGCIPVSWQQRLLQKVAQLSVSFVWTATDLQEEVSAAPGSGTLVPGSLACILQVILAFLDFRAAWLSAQGS